MHHASFRRLLGLSLSKNIRNSRGNTTLYSNSTIYLELATSKKSNNWWNCTICIDTLVLLYMFRLMFRLGLYRSVPTLGLKYIMLCCLAGWLAAAGCAG